MGTTASDTTTLSFEFTDSTANSLANSRNYEIKVTQLPCSSEYKYVYASLFHDISLIFLYFLFLFFILVLLVDVFSIMKV